MQSVLNCTKLRAEGCSGVHLKGITGGAFRYELLNKFSPKKHKFSFWSVEFTLVLEVKQRGVKLVMNS